MRTRSKLLLAALSASLLLGLAVGNASATRLKILNSTSGFRIVWRPLRLIGAGNTLSCNVTLEGTFHNSTYAKTARNLIGNITTAIVEGSTCTGGSAVILPRFPWNVQYVSFEGTLPVITGIRLRLIGAAFQITPTGSLTCLAITTETEPAIGVANLSEAGGGLQRLNSLTAKEEAAIRLTGSGGLCTFGGTGSFGGTGTASILGGTAKTIVSLI